MSEDVFLYQCAILLSVIASGMLFGKRGGLWVAAGWAMWTLVMIFTKFLFILQGLTILISWAITKRLTDSPKYLKYRRNFITTITGIAILLLGGGILAFYSDSTRKNNINDRPINTNNAPATTLPPPALSSPPTAQSLYETAVSNVERQYPQLNPDLPAHDSAAVNAVVDRKNFLASQGIPSHIAVQRAADEYFSSTNRRSGEVFKCAKGVYQDYPCTK